MLELKWKTISITPYAQKKWETTSCNPLFKNANECGLWKRDE